MRVEPGTAPKATIPINRFTVRSFITSVTDGAKLKAGRTTLRGIAFDGGKGIKDVAVSTDGGKTWMPAKLGKDLGKYSFREWKLPVKLAAGAYELKVRATSNGGETQPDDAALESGGLPAQRRRNRPRHAWPEENDHAAHRSPRHHARRRRIGSVRRRCAARSSTRLPEETAAFKPGPNLEVVQGNCTACHSADYISTQPPMKVKKDFWQAEVTKMIKVYGAPIDDADVGKIVDYLAATLLIGGAAGRASGGHSDRETRGNTSKCAAKSS